MNFQRVNRLLHARECRFQSVQGCASQRLTDVPTTFKTKDLEDGVYEFWERNNFFNPENSDKEPLKMILPPPNVTGVLHLGHALTVTVQDVLARWYRMRGHPVVWVPGLDHAGIATQAILEKQIFKTQGLSRADVGKETFLSKISVWKKEKGDVINKQLRALGASLDWSKEYFTLSDRHSRAVMETFIALHQRGLVYRQKDLVNWCTALQSTISDIEVYHLYIEGKTPLDVPGYKDKVTFGQMAQLRFPVKDSKETLTIATTRPETVFGDVALAVNPNDSRYGSFVGKQVWHPIRRTYIPVVADSAVYGDFGTGVVKVTPAHNETDYSIAKRHDLEIIDVIDEQGNITEAGDEYKGLPRFLVRDKVLDYFASENLLVSMDDHKMSVPLCSRSGDVVELLQKEQWFVKCKDMADRAARAVRDGSLKLVPSAYEEGWCGWLENVKDWCVSRQIWWGHQIPAYGVRVGDRTEFVVARSERDARTLAMEKYGTDLELKQDADVFDTWFSSAILPWTVMGWPDEMESFNKNYPLTLMETGHDILFFWVARMTMLGLEMTGKLPFQEAILHGVLCDANGKKMSKSVGNVISPEHVIHGISLNNLIEEAKTSHKTGVINAEELKRTINANKKMFPHGIPECGTDALRMSLCNRNIKNVKNSFDVMDCVTNKHFCNKIWQASRYVLLNVEGNSLEEPKSFTLMDRWILSRLALMVDAVNNAFAERNFHEAMTAIRQFLYYEFCDFYLEGTKAGFRSEDAEVKASHAHTLSKCLEVSLRILAPVAPFSMEKFYETLSTRLPGFQTVNSLLQASYPMPEEFQNLRNVELDEEVMKLTNVLLEVRKLLAGVKRKEVTEVLLVVNESDCAFYNDCLNLIRGIVAIKNVAIGSNDLNRTENSVYHNVNPDCTIVITSMNADVIEVLKKNVAKTSTQEYRKSASN